jgi:PII-like signaling protein
MRAGDEATLLRIYIGEADRWHGRPLYQAIVEMVRREGLAGVTVLRGIMGFGAHSHMHSARILRLSEDLPIVVDIIDADGAIEKIRPAIDAMVGDGLVIRQSVQVVSRRPTDEENP